MMRIDLGIPPALTKILRILSMKQVRVFLYCLLAVVIVYTRFPTLDARFRKRTGKADSCLKNATIVELDASHFDKCTSDFLRNYLKYCEERLRPAVTGKQCLCPCASSLLEGEIHSSDYAPSFTDMEEMNPENAAGGWTPRFCIPRHRVAVIIPYANRLQHLKVFLKVMHPLLQKQLLHYQIFVIEQSKPYIFNKGMLQNAGFVEADRFGEFDCFIFHDVDLLPTTDLNFYVCTPSPRHVGAFVDKWKNRVFYDEMFGGATAFTKDQFKLINGFSNSYEGWGGEDDDLYLRVLFKKYRISRYPQCIAKYHMIRHNRDYRNPKNPDGVKGWFYRPDSYQREGLNTLKYEVSSISVNKLYINISVELKKVFDH